MRVTEQSEVKLVGTARAEHQGGEIISTRIDDRSVMFQIVWDDGKVGDYRGFLYADGHLRGTTFQTFPQIDDPPMANWWSVAGTFKLEWF